MNPNFDFRDRAVVYLGEFMDGPDEEFPEEKSFQPLGVAAAIVTFIVAILVVL